MDIPRHWRGRGARYRLEGQRNRSSGAVRFPARPPLLGEEPDLWEPHRLSGQGELYSFSVQRQVPAGYQDQAPLAVGMVRLDEGPLVTAQLADCGEADLQIGMRVEMVTRRLADTGPDGVLVYGYKFRPLLTTE